MLRQVVVGSVGNAPQFAPSEREQKFKVGGRFAVEAELFGIVVAKAQVFVFKSEREQPFVAEIAPVRKPFEVGSGFAEKFEFHLFEFAHAENEVSGCDFVTERLTYLTYTERHFLSRRTLNVYEVGKNTLSGFGSQINGVFRVLGYALESFEHQVELTYVGEVVMLAGGAGNVVLFNESLHFRLRERVDGLT